LKHKNQTAITNLHSAGKQELGGVKTTTSYKAEKIAEKIESPFAIVTMPDRRLFITSKSGYAEIYDASGKLIKKITGFSCCCFCGTGRFARCCF
jgi:glucose/arabinose dehydrogenase